MLDASGIIYVAGDRFLVAEDEIDVLRFFVLDKQQRTFRVTTETADFGHNESDFESLAFDSVNQRYYCTGSYGEDYSRRLLSFQLAGNTVSEQSEISFDAGLLINGPVDIEGLSVWGTRLFLGYRKPSRKKLALAVLFDVNSGSQILTSFNLAGRTFRDINRLDDHNYLILAGPEQGKNYKTLPSCIFWWNGDVLTPQLKLCQVDLTGFRAEGLATRRYDDGSIDVLIGSDESKMKAAKKFRLMDINLSGIPDLVNGTHKARELTVIC